MANLKVFHSLSAFHQPPKLLFIALDAIGYNARAAIKRYNLNPSHLTLSNPNANGIQHNLFTHGNQAISSNM